LVQRAQPIRNADKIPNTKAAHIQVKRLHAQHDQVRVEPVVIIKVD
jgi:hypothetical protein